uniref:Uncharacterized protein n=1 Tax=Anguilla anguilla TaxID=7936 RepID=A0A0E9PUN1_ANGAN
MCKKNSWLRQPHMVEAKCLHSGNDD